MTEAEITVDILKKLEDKLDPYLSEELRNSQFFVDLADIHEICRSYLSMIDNVISSDDKGVIEESLDNIETELFDHFPYHFKSLKKLLPEVIDEIEK